MQHIHSRQIHTLTISISDDNLGKIEEGDNLEIVIQSRWGATSPKAITYREVCRLLNIA